MTYERIKAKTGERLSKRDLRRKLYQRLSVLGWLIYMTGAARYHDDGDGLSVVFRWWHPVSWLFVVALVIPCAIFGIRIGEAVPFRVSKYWRENRDRLNWL